MLRLGDKRKANKAVDAMKHYYEGGLALVETWKWRTSSFATLTTVHFSWNHVPSLAIYTSGVPCASDAVGK